MTTTELKKQCLKNQQLAVEEKEKKVKEFFKALYKDCEEELKTDSKPCKNYPSDYTPFDLFIDNIIFSVKSDIFKDIEFIQLLKELNKVEFADATDFAY